MEEEFGFQSEPQPVQENSRSQSDNQSNSRGVEANEDLSFPAKKVKLQPTEENLLQDINNLHLDEAVASQEQKEPEPGQPKLVKPKKPLTAYFIFLKEYKSREDKDKMTSLNIHKDLASIWNSMTKDEKQKYIDLHLQEQKRYNEEMEVYKAKLEETNADVSEEEEGPTQSLVTVSKVKKLIKSDPDVRKTKKSTCELIAQLTEAFGTYLLDEASKNMKLDNRKKLAVNDLLTVSRKIEAFNFLEEAGVFHDYEVEKAEKEHKIQEEKKNASSGSGTTAAATTATAAATEKSGKKSKASNAPANNSRIMDFFSKK